jgi:hypothetical protein
VRDGERCGFEKLHGGLSCPKISLRVRSAHGYVWRRYRMLSGEQWIPTNARESGCLSHAEEIGNRNVWVALVREEELGLVERLRLQRC